MLDKLRMKLIHRLARKVNGDFEIVKTSPFTIWTLTKKVEINPDRSVKMPS